jgi:lysophospholipase L1-like esterase
MGWAGVFIVLFSLLFLLIGCSPSTATNPQKSATPVLQQPPKAHLTYVAIGASDTYGIGTDDPETESWPANLRLRLGKDTRLINLGIPGIHLHDALRVELPVALDAHPGVVTVWLAVNDLVDNVPIESYARDLDTLLSRLHTALPRAHIAVANVPDLTLLPRFRQFDQQLLRQRITAYNATIASRVERHALILVDLYRAWDELATHPEYVSNDGFHPNAVGYIRVAQLFYQQLQQHGV